MLVNEKLDGSKGLSDLDSANCHCADRRSCFSSILCVRIGADSDDGLRHPLVLVQNFKLIQYRLALKSHKGLDRASHVRRSRGPEHVAVRRAHGTSDVDGSGRAAAIWSGSGGLIPGGDCQIWIGAQYKRTSGISHGPSGRGRFR
jgi:hypothetical protein